MKNEDSFISNSVFMEVLVNEREILFEKLNALNNLSLLYLRTEIYDLEIEKTKEQKDEKYMKNAHDGFGLNEIARARRIKIYNIVVEAKKAQCIMDIVEYSNYEYSDVSNDLLYLTGENKLFRHTIKANQTNNIRREGIGRRSYYYTEMTQLENLKMKL